MTKPLIVAIGDIHGCYLTLQALLRQVAVALLGQPYRVISLGDNIDRGPHSREVVEWAMKNRIEVCQGNHEHLAVDYHLCQLEGCGSQYDYGVWHRNGGLNVLRSWNPKNPNLKRLPRAVIAWMDKLPLFIIPPEYPDLLLSHTGHGLITKDSQHTPFDAVWARAWQFPPDGRYRIFGHTPVKEPVVTDTYANIDTGCAYPKGRKLTAMVWPTRQIIQQDYID